MARIFQNDPDGYNEPDGYYGDDSTDKNELDLSFLDEDNE